MMHPHEVEFFFRGLWIKADIEPYTPEVRYLPNGDPGYPAEGGGCYGYTWEIEDIDDLLLEAGLSSEGMDNMVRAFYFITGKLPKTLENKLLDQWHADIEEAAEEEYMETRHERG